MLATHYLLLPTPYCLQVRTYGEDHFSLLRATLVSGGRMHQIRRHLAEAGWPVIGDRLYGGSPVSHEEKSDEPLALSACQLHFRAPEDGTLKQYHLPEQPGTLLASAQKKALPE